MRIVLILCLLFLSGCGEINYKTMAGGEIERYEYLNGGWGTSDKTIIYFKDGSSYIIPGQLPIPAKKIKILYGTDGITERYKIEISNNPTP